MLSVVEAVRERDDAAGAFLAPAFTLLGNAVDPLAHLSQVQLAVLDRAGVRSVMLLGPAYDIATPPASSHTQRLVALDEQADQWFSVNEAQVVLVRPDFYACGRRAGRRPRRPLCGRSGH